MTPDTPITLTPAQLRFGNDLQASPGMEAEGLCGVFFYRETGGWVQRWLVDADGNVRDEAQFRCHPVSPEAGPPSLATGPRQQVNTNKSSARRPPLGGP
jgi:hypothetical protein